MLVPEEDAMHEFTDRLTQMTHKELLYIEGYLCMHRDRYAEYERDLKLARARGDAKRAGEIAEDLRAFRREIAYLQRKQASVYERLRVLANDERFAVAGGADEGTTPPIPQDIGNITSLNIS
jgi:hypothetical protein